MFRKNCAATAALFSIMLLSGTAMAYVAPVEPVEVEDEVCSESEIDAAYQEGLAAAATVETVSTGASEPAYAISIDTETETEAEVETEEKPSCKGALTPAKKPSEKTCTVYCTPEPKPARDFIRVLQGPCHKQKCDAFAAGVQGQIFGTPTDLPPKK